VSDLISKNDLDEEIRELFYTEDNMPMNLTKYGEFIYNSAINAAHMKVLEAPLVDAVPVRYGRWIEVRDKWGSCVGEKCSECGRRVKNGGENYCPKCGSKNGRLILL
jgi:hypothetical protein